MRMQKLIMAEMLKINERVFGRNLSELLKSYFTIIRYDNINLLLSVTPVTTSPGLKRTAQEGFPWYEIYCIIAFTISIEKCKTL